MELSSSHVGEIETRLRGVESERTSVEDERARLESNRESYLAASQGDSDIEAEQRGAVDAQYEIAVARLDARRDELDEEIAVLRTRLATRERELEDWETYVDRRLGSL